MDPGMFIKPQFWRGLKASVTLPEELEVLRKGEPPPLPKAFQWFPLPLGGSSSSLTSHEVCTVWLLHQSRSLPHLCSWASVDSLTHLSSLQSSHSLACWHLLILYISPAEVVWAPQKPRSVHFLGSLLAPLLPYWSTHQDAGNCLFLNRKLPGGRVQITVPLLYTEWTIA